MTTWGRKEIEIALKTFENEEHFNSNSLKRFEDSFCNFQNCNAALFFQNCRSALSFLLSCLDLGSEDEIIMSPYSCVVVYNCIAYSGAKTIFSDIELQSLSVDFDSFKSKVSPKTKAVIIPHLMGYIARDLEKITAYCKSKGIFVIEDCAQAQGAELNGIKVGNYGDAAIFSFEQSKVLSTINGGALTIKNKLLFEKAKANYKELDFLPRPIEQEIIDFGLANYAQFVSESFNYQKKKNSFKSTIDCELRHEKPGFYGFKLNPIFAEIGIIQLTKFNQLQSKRNQQVEAWKKLFKHKKITHLEPVKGSAPSYLRLAATISEKDKTAKKFHPFKGHVLGYWYSTLLDPADLTIPNVPNAVQATKHVINFPTLIN